MRKKNGKKIIVVLTTMAVIVSGMEFPTQKSVSAADNFSIVSPENNQVKGAGYITIDWEDVNGVSNYSLYVDGQCVITTTTSQYDYYTTKVKYFDTYVQANMSDGSTITTDTVTFGVSKKGLAVNSEMAAHLNAEDFNVGWYYDWGTGPLSYSTFSGLDFVPMIWGTGANGQIGSIYNKGYRYLLSYNEPDLSGQANIDVNTVLNNWGIFTNYDFYLGAPVTATTEIWGNTWMTTFFENVDMDSIDYIPLHYYAAGYGGTGGAEYFLNSIVDAIYEKYKKPIWVTEIAPSEMTSRYGTETGQSECYSFLNALMDGLDQRDYVERYSWFSFDTSDTTNGAAALFSKSNGQMTELGKLYASKGNPVKTEEETKVSESTTADAAQTTTASESTTEAVTQTETTSTTKSEEPEYSTSVTTRNTLLSDEEEIDGNQYNDLIKVNSATATDSEHMGTQTPSLAIDENIGSRWETVHGNDPEYITIDFGKVQYVKQVDIIWETASASDYYVQISKDGSNFTNIASYSGGKGTDHRLDTIKFTDLQVARYVRIYGTARSTQYGYSIWDMAIYGSDSEPKTQIENVGVQYNLSREGIRVVYNLEPEHNGSSLVEYGNIIAVVGNDSVASPFTKDSEVTLDNLGAYAKKYISTSAGLSEKSYSQSDTASTYVMTFINNGNTAQAYNQYYLINSYATYADGTTVYSGTYAFSVYKLADYLYANRLMETEKEHNDLYDKILKVADIDYPVVTY